MNRWSFLRLGRIIWPAGLILFASFGLTAASERPSIVIIMADDMGFSDIGSYGGEIRTPNLDRLAHNGLRFSQFYNAARCCPTRAALLTGLYPHQAGVGHMVQDRGRPGYLGRLNERCVTIAEVLGAAGYQTIMSGKWHVTPYDYSAEPQLHRDSWPTRRGFRHFFGTLAGAGSYFTPVSLMERERFIEPGEGFYYTDAINDYAARRVAEAEPGPLFLYVAHVAPHWPLHALPEDIELYAGVYDVGWDELRARRHARLLETRLVDPDWPLTPRDDRVPAWSEASDRDWESHRMAVYAAQVDRMDRGIGRIVEALERTGRLENTLILFLADNGGCAEIIQGTDTRHGHFPRGGTRPEIRPGGPDTYAAYGVGWANASNTPFRLYKQWVHEGGIASPLVAHWPKGIADRGAIRQQVGHVVDLMATSLDIAGVEYPTEFQGRAITPLEGISLVPAFADETLVRPQGLFWEHMGHRAVRIGDWKLVAERGQPWELYNLRADRTETEDLAERSPERVRTLVEAWEAWAERARVEPWPLP
jgi:arylsulfatase A-like enzyme